MSFAEEGNPRLSPVIGDGNALPSSVIDLTATQDPTIHTMDDTAPHSTHTESTDTAVDQTFNSFPTDTIMTDLTTTSPEDPTIARLRTRLPEKTTTTIGEINEWVSKQHATGQYMYLKNPIEQYHLSQEIATVSSKLAELQSKQAQESSGEDSGADEALLASIKDIIYRATNTHPSIVYATFPIPSWILNLRGVAYDELAKPLKQQMQEYTQKVQILEVSYEKVMQHLSELKDMPEQDREMYYQHCRNNNFCLDIYAQMNQIVEENVERTICFQAGQFALKPGIARKMLETGIVATSQSRVSPISIEDLTEEANVIKSQITRYKSRISLIRAKIASISHQSGADIRAVLASTPDTIINDDILDCSTRGLQGYAAADFVEKIENFNPWTAITPQMASVALQNAVRARANSIESVEVAYNVVPGDINSPDNAVPAEIIDMETGDMIPNPDYVPSDMTTINLQIKQAILANKGLGYFFQLGKNNTISDFKHTSSVQVEVVSDGAKTAPASATLQQIQPSTNIERAAKYFNDKSTDGWYQSILDAPCNKNTREPGIPFNNTLFKIDLKNTMVPGGGRCTETTDIGAILPNNQVQPFILAIIRSLKTDSTHYTVRIFFNDIIQQQLRPLMDLYSGRNSPTVPGASKQINGQPLAGLLNQGVTCYLNTYLQALYNLPLFRKYLFNLPIMNRALPGRNWEKDPQATEKIAEERKTVYTPKLLHSSQTAGTQQFATPEDLVRDCYNEDKWTVEPQPNGEEPKYMIPLREFVLRHGFVGAHNLIEKLEDLHSTPITTTTEGTPATPLKKWNVTKLLQQRTTQTAATLQRLFLHMQYHSNNYFKYIYHQNYKQLTRKSVESLLKHTPAYLAIFNSKDVPQSIVEHYLYDSTYIRDPFFALRTNELTKSFLSKDFGWDPRSLHEQQDLQELARKLAESLETSAYNSVVEGAYQRLFRSYVDTVIEATNPDVKFTKVQPDVTYDELILQIKGIKEPTLDSCIEGFSNPDIIDGYNTEHPEHKKQQIFKYSRLTRKLPPILTFMLGRMDFCMQTFQQIKINDQVIFPAVLDMSRHVYTPPTEPAAISAPAPLSNEALEKHGIDLDSYPEAHHVPNEANHCPKHKDQSLIYDLYSVLVHIGNSHSGHYINFIRPVRNTSHLPLEQENNSYTIPNNEYQINDALFAKMKSSGATNDLSADMNLMNINPEIPDDPETGECTCHFDHKKAEHYRQGDWFKFDDESVTLVPAIEAINDNYGGISGRFNAGKSAYLLMYINRKYSYYDDRTNNGDDLIFHPLVTKTLLGQQELLPASELMTPLELFKGDEMATLKFTEQMRNHYEELKMEVENQVELTADVNNIPVGITVDTESKKDQTESQDVSTASIINSFATEVDKLTSDCQIAQELKDYTDLSAVQQQYKNFGASQFVQIQPPLALSRVIAQQDAQMRGPQYNTPQQQQMGSCQGGLAGAYPRSPPDYILGANQAHTAEFAEP